LTIKMAFGAIIRAVLEEYTAFPPETQDAWYGPWISILTTLFPSVQGYVVTPQHRLTLEDDQSHIRDFVIEVVKLNLSAPPLMFRTVLIVKIRNTQHGHSELGMQRLQDLIERQCYSAFIGTAHTKVYWIGTIGPHWRYGERVVDGQAPIPLINWHDTTHDQASFNDLQVLADLIHAM
jgi:hypothetical protein